MEVRLVSAVIPALHHGLCLSRYGLQLRLGAGAIKRNYRDIVFPAEIRADRILPSLIGLYSRGIKMEKKLIAMLFRPDRGKRILNYEDIGLFKSYLSLMGNSRHSLAAKWIVIDTAGVVKALIRCPACVNRLSHLCGTLSTLSKSVDKDSIMSVSRASVASCV